MENRKKIGISLTVGVLLISWAYVLSQKKPNNYWYELTSSSGTVNAPTIITGAIAPANSNVLAYLNNWSGIVQRQRGGEIRGMDTDIQFQEGDIITTGDDSTAEIVFSDNSLVRMNARSKLTLVKLSSEGSEVALDEGDIWARVLKPLYDTSFFTISTSDVSAGVQGTSVRVRKELSGMTDVEVIDSYALDPVKEGVVLRYNNPKRKVWSEQLLRAETRFTYSNSGASTHMGPFSGKTAFTDTFIRDNTKRDLVYMETLAKKTKNDKNLSDRLTAEMLVTVPKQEEVSEFFDEPELKKIVLPGEMSASGVKMDTDTQAFVMDNVRWDLSIKDKSHVIMERKGRLSRPMKPDEKKKVEGEIQSAEQEIKTMRREIRKTMESLDTDKDGIPDVSDSCPMVPNPDQKDSNANNIWDACEPVTATGIIRDPVKVVAPVLVAPKIIAPVTPLDTDKDGIPDLKDNCPKVANPRQENTYGDIRGDACEPRPVVAPTPIVRTIISGEVKIQ